MPNAESSVLTMGSSIGARTFWTRPTTELMMVASALVTVPFAGLGVLPLGGT